jgi:hypothetical protein
MMLLCTMLVPSWLAKLLSATDYHSQLRDPDGGTHQGKFEPQSGKRRL